MSEPTPEFHIAVIYDTEEQAHRAERICRRLVEQFNGEFLFHIALCDFAGFEAAGGASPAIRQANRATLVVVAASTPPPRRFWTWLQDWATEAAHGGAGIAALTDAASTATETVTALQQMCRHHDIDFITPATETVTSSAQELNATGGPTHETISLPAAAADAEVGEGWPVRGKDYSISGDEGGPNRG